jgi:arabinofuranosyltransferase
VNGKRVEFSPSRVRKAPAGLDTVNRRSLWFCLLTACTGLVFGGAALALTHAFSVPGWVCLCIGAFCAWLLVQTRPTSIEPWTAVAGIALGALFLAGLFLARNPNPETSFLPLRWEPLLAFCMLAVGQHTRFAHVKWSWSAYVAFGAALAAWLFRTIPVFLLPGILALAAVVGAALLVSNRLSRSERPTNEMLLVIGALATIYLIVVCNAWIADDAFITLRTIDNFVHGHGLTWNAAERVQAYTHPLWLMLLVPPYALFRERYFTPIFLGIFFTLAALLLLAFKVAKDSRTAFAAIFVLSLSKAFIDYTTSGLENACSYFLLASFVLVHFTRSHSRYHIFGLALIAALGMLARLDNFFLFVVPLSFTCWQQRRRGILNVSTQIVAGFAPLAAWEGFSLIYYGFPFPNTAYAKLDMSCSQWHTMAKGFEYVANSIRHDPVTMLSILAGGLWLSRAAFSGARAFSAGALAHMVYVISIGGDFMSGRFLALPFLGIVLAASASATLDARQVIGTVACLVLLAAGLPFNPWKSRGSYQNTELAGDIADERGWYYPVTGLLHANPAAEFPRGSLHPFLEWEARGREARESGEPVVLGGAVGILGYSAGPSVWVVDGYGIGDVLLARLPPVPGPQRVGHVRRQIPAGYLASLRLGENRLANRTLASAYERLNEITRGNVWSWHRFKTIWEANVGTLARESRSASFEARHAFIRSGSHASAAAAEQAEGFMFVYQFSLVEKALQRAVLADPNSPEALANVAVYHEMIGEREIAAHEYDRLSESFGAQWAHYRMQLEAAR